MAKWWGRQTQARGGPQACLWIHMLYSLAFPSLRREGNVERWIEARDGEIDRMRSGLRLLGIAAICLKFKKVLFWTRSDHTIDQSEAAADSDTGPTQPRLRCSLSTYAVAAVTTSHPIFRAASALASAIWLPSSSQDLCSDMPQPHSALSNLAAYFQFTATVLSDMNPIRTLDVFSHLRALKMSRIKPTSPRTVEPRRSFELGQSYSKHKHKPQSELEGTLHGRIWINAALKGRRNCGSVVREMESTGEVEMWQKVPGNSRKRRMRIGSILGKVPCGLGPRWAARVTGRVIDRGSEEKKR
ncbi:hypothetical protein DFH09DRAFT_1477906 [Mycena vulgaris]|nr:hypothetical protein DFH09DRAFT_1477906 [Mycena vulgaris]